MPPKSPTPKPPIVVIPARGGSKRIKKKNVAPFFGVPMIRHVIERLAGSASIKDIVVSTDDVEIASAVQGLTDVTISWRPGQLADDHSTTIDVLRHECSLLAEAHAPDTVVACVYPTSVFVSPEIVLSCAQPVQSGQWTFAVTVQSLNKPIARLLHLDEANRLAMNQPQYASARTQDLKSAYFDAAQAYAGQIQSWQSEASVFGAKTYGVKLTDPVCDIDYPQDILFAQCLFNAFHSHGNKLHDNL